MTLPSMRINVPAFTGKGHGLKPPNQRTAVANLWKNGSKQNPAYPVFVRPTMWDQNSTQNMDISVKGKNLDVGDALKGHVEEHLLRTVTKYFGRALDANVMFTREGRLARADISVHPGPRGMVVQGGSESDDPYAAFDGALERISKQLRRYKRRLSNHHKGHHPDVFPALQYVIQPDHEDEEVAAEGQPAIVAEMPTEIATLSVSEAVMRMDLADLPVNMFRNSSSGRLNVVYHRADGNIGWIDPSDGIEDENGLNGSK